MIQNDVVLLARHRLEQAYECLKLAKAAIELGFYKGAANRSYYAIFHGMRAILAIDQYDSKKHSGIISEFRRAYIKTGKLPAPLSKIIDNAFDMRQNSDYEDFFVISKSDILHQIEDATNFLEAVEEYINTLT